MKKLLFFFAAAFLATININAQQCIPEPSFNGPGSYPSTITNLDPAYVNTPYFQTITFVVPSQYAISPAMIATIDSLVIDSISNLPASMSYVCNTTNCTTLKNGKGSVCISGTPNAGEINTYTLKICATIYGTYLTMSGGYPYPYKDYKIIISDVSSTLDINSPELKQLKNIPNPFNGSTKISFISNKSEKTSFLVYDHTGKVVFEDVINSVTGENEYTFNANTLHSGIYLYSLKSSNGVISKTMMIE